MQFKIWHIPQVPGQAFEVTVTSLLDAQNLLNVLASYDQFQYDNNIKPDYTNMGGLVYYNEEEQDWMDWEHPETGQDVQEISPEELRRLDIAMIREEIHAQTTAALKAIKDGGMVPTMTAEEVLKLTRE